MHYLKFNLTNAQSKECLDSFNHGALDRHNFHRNRHGSANLKLNDEVTGVAVSYAQQINQDDTFKHNPDLTTLNYGENLWRTGGSGNVNITNLEICKSKHAHLSKNKRFYI